MVYLFRKRGFEYIGEEDIPVQLPNEFPRTIRDGRSYIKKLNFVWWVHTKEIVNTPYFTRLKEGCVDDNIFENIEKVKKFNPNTFSPEKKKEFYEGISQKLKGRLMHPMTDKMREKISKANKGRIHPEEQNIKQSEYMKRQFKEGKREKKFGENNPSWKGGILKHEGYNYIKRRVALEECPNLPKDFPVFSKRKKEDYIKRANFIWWKNTGEIIKFPYMLHHKNEIKDDDNFENLEKTTRREHLLKYHKKNITKR